MRMMYALLIKIQEKDVDQELGNAYNSLYNQAQFSTL